ncbi:hypothetical protein B0H14DRAFT_2578561 [Mycena olivaceomarginata]|nr:hypothetical protein B0H14DRAFT_2578561 [Mycena olivaceomarginata]
MMESKSKNVELTRLWPAMESNGEHSDSERNPKAHFAALMQEINLGYCMQDMKTTCLRKIPKKDVACAFLLHYPSSSGVQPFLTRGWGRLQDSSFVRICKAVPTARPKQPSSSCQAWRKKLEGMWSKKEANLECSARATFGGGSKRARSLGLSTLVVHWSQWWWYKGKIARSIP